MNNFGRWLRFLRETYELSQYELATRSGTDQTYISLLENGLKRNPSEKMIVRLSLGLNDALIVSDILRITVGLEPFARGDNRMTLDEVLCLMKDLEKEHPRDRLKMLR